MEDWRLANASDRSQLYYNGVTDEQIAEGPEPNGIHREHPCNETNREVELISLLGRHLEERDRGKRHLSGLRSLLSSQRTQA